MKVIKVNSYSELSKLACDFLVKDISRKPDLIIGFATGDTPLGLYKCLVSSYKKKKVDFSKIKSFNLDEYYPMKKSNRNSYYRYMLKNLFSKINMKEKNINFLNGETRNPKRECERYERLIKQNLIDVQILGVGVNGHIGFNEPGSNFNSKTRIVNLSEDTLKQNSKLFKSRKNIPKKALSMGIKTILSAKKIILLVSGRDKADAIKCLIKGKIDKNCPVSILSKHKNLIVIVSKEVLK